MRRHSRQVFRAIAEALESRCLLSGLTVLQHSFAYDYAHSLDIAFDKGFNDLPDPQQIAMLNLTTGTPVPDTHKTIDASSGTSIYVELSPLLEDGNYESNLLREGIVAFDGSTLDQDSHADFFVLEGDVNHDRVINECDFAVWDTSFNSGTGAGVSSGDVNYDSIIDLDDYNILAGRYGTTLHEPPTGTEVGTFTYGSSFIQVNWFVESFENVDSFRIYRSTDGAVFTEIDEIPAAMVYGYGGSSGFGSVWSEGLTDGTKYWYRVRPWSEEYGLGASLSRAWAVTTLPAPSNPTITDVTAGELTLNWQDHSSSEANFIIERAIGNGPFAVYKSDVPANTTSYRITGLNEDTQYKFRVRAKNSASESITSLTASTTTKLKAPTGFDAWAFSKTQLQFAWHNESNVASDVVIDLKRFDGSVVGSYTCSAPAELFVISNLAEGTIYRATMHAADASNSSATSEELLVTTAGRMYTNSGGLEFMPDAVSASSSPGNIFFPTIGDGEKSVTITGMTNHVVLDGSVTVTGFTLSQPAGDEDSFSILVAGEVVGAYTFTHESPMAAGFTTEFRFDHQAANTTVEIVAEDLEPDERWFVDAMLVNAVQTGLVFVPESGATQTNVTNRGGENNWAAVKSNDSDARMLAIPLDSNLSTVEFERLIQWNMGALVQNDSTRVDIDKSVSTKKHITAKIGKATAFADLWVVWADVEAKLSGNTPPNSPQFPSDEYDGTQRLGAVQYDSNQNRFGALKIVIIAKLQPPGAGKVVRSGWSIDPWRWGKDLVDGAPSGVYWEDKWTFDTPRDYALSLIPDASDQLYFIDAPTVGKYENAITSYEVRTNFRTSVKWSDVRAADHLYWYYHALWISQIPNIQINIGDLGEMNIP